MNTNFEKRERHLLLGVLGCPLFTLLLGMVWHCVRKEHKVRP